MYQFANFSSRAAESFSSAELFSISVRASFGLEQLQRGEVDFGHFMGCACAGCSAVASEGHPKVLAQDESSLATFAGGVDVPGDLSTGATIAVGGSLTGELEVVGDTDWYRIELAAGDSIGISLFGSGASPVSDTYLRVYDANGNLIAENDDGGEGLNSFLRFVSDNGGTYYIEADSYGNNKIGEFTLQVSEVQPLELYSNDQIAYQLTNGYWGGTARSWNVGSDGQLTYDVSALPADARFLAQQALLLWGDATGIQFVPVTGNAEITFQDSASGAYASSSWSGGTIISATVNISAQWLANYGTGLNSYSFQTYIHEIGHALGLGHGGNYNGSASYATDASYLNDSWATTVMSYFSQTENDYFAELGFSQAYVTTPMSADLVAVDDLYGLSTTTRLGNTVYGFNNTSGRAVFDAAAHPATAYAIIDSGGRDTLNYSGFTADQLIDLRAEKFSSIGGLVGNVSIARGTVIEDAQGGSGADTIIGNDAANTVRGNAGDDTIFGGLGNDRLLGGDGNDSIDGEGGNDRIEGNDGNDTIYGGFGDDIIDGKNDADTIFGEEGKDRLYGAKGNDLVYGGDDNDVIYGGGGSDLIFGESGSDWISGGHGNDTLNGDGGNDRIDGNEGNDRINGGDGGDTLYGGDGHDTINGGTGNDIIDGKDGADKLYGDDGQDRIYGAWGDDSIYGGGDGDDIYGGGGSDLMFGGSGADQIFGGHGNDLLRGDAGNDILSGENGNDVFFFDLAGAGDADQITDFASGQDTIRLDMGGDFAGLTQTGTLAASAFRRGTAAGDADDRIIYDETTGNLWYDADGDGAQAAELFATLAPNTVLAASDFDVVNSASAAAAASTSGHAKEPIIEADQVLFI